MSCHKPGGNSAVSSIACALTLTASDEVSRIFHRLKAETSNIEQVPSAQEIMVWLEKQSMKIRSEPNLSALRKERILSRITLAAKQINEGTIPDSATWHAWVNLEAECEHSPKKMLSTYYHGTPIHNLRSIVKENCLYPSSGDNVTAGASGIYLAGKESAVSYGVLIHLAVSEDIEIAGDIVEDKELEEMRSAYQIINDEDYHDEETREELLDGMGLSAIDEDLAMDVSGVLEGAGFGGHFDSMVEKGDLIIYNPEDITILGATVEGRYLSLEELRNLSSAELEKISGKSI